MPVTAGQLPELAGQQLPNRLQKMFEKKLSLKNVVFLHLNFFADFFRLFQETLQQLPGGSFRVAAGAWLPAAEPWRSSRLWGVYRGA